jgi:hypothetical protein
MVERNCSSLCLAGKTALVMPVSQWHRNFAIIVNGGILRSPNSAAVMAVGTRSAHEWQDQDRGWRVDL